MKMIYEIGMILRSRNHGGKITLMAKRSYPVNGIYDCYSHDSKITSQYGTIELVRYWEFRGEYDKATKILYGGK